MNLASLVINRKLYNIFSEYGQLQPFPDSPFLTQDDFFDQNQFQPIKPDEIQPEFQPEVIVVRVFIQKCSYTWSRLIKTIYL